MDKLITWDRNSKTVMKNRSDNNPIFKQKCHINIDIKKSIFLIRNITDQQAQKAALGVFELPISLCKHAILIRFLNTVVTA